MRLICILQPMGWQILFWPDYTKKVNSKTYISSQCTPKVDNWSIAYLIWLSFYPKLSKVNKSPHWSEPSSGKQMMITLVWWFCKFWNAQIWNWYYNFRFIIQDNEVIMGNWICNVWFYCRLGNSVWRHWFNNGHSIEPCNSHEKETDSEKVWWPGKIEGTTYVLSTFSCLDG